MNNSELDDGISLPSISHPDTRRIGYIARLFQSFRRADVTPDSLEEFEIELPDDR